MVLPVSGCSVAEGGEGPRAQLGAATISVGPPPLGTQSTFLKGLSTAHRLENTKQPWGSLGVLSSWHRPHPGTVPLAIPEGGVLRNIPAAPTAYCRERGA